MPPQAPPVHWSVNRAHELLWRSWGPGEFVVYHRESGETHLLNAVTAFVLRTLRSEPLTCSELADRAADEFGPEFDEPEKELETLLGHLDRLGLVDRGPAP